MRALIVTSPGIGHTFPTIPTAWALRAAGHEVVLATSRYHDTAARSGLPVVDVAPGVDFGAVIAGFRAKGSIPAFGGPADTAARMAAIGPLFAAVSEHYLAHTVALARLWRPDLVISTPLEGAGPLTAAVLGVPLVLHGFDLGRVSRLWRDVAGHLAHHYERFGVSPAGPAAVLDVAPPSMRLAGADGWPMRFVPYNGGAVLPSWLNEQPKSPRVAVTLGSVAPTVGGVGALKPFAAAAGAVDAEFVLALGGADVADLGELPANVRAVAWTPLGALLRTCAAAIHHGGGGTMLTAMDAGVPQLVLPHAGDQFINADAVAGRGAGDRVEPGDLDEQRLRALLADTSMRAAAESVAAEMAAQPSPAELVPRLVALAG